MGNGSCVAWSDERDGFGGNGHGGEGMSALLLLLVGRVGFCCRDGWAFVVYFVILAHRALVKGRGRGKRVSEGKRG